MSGLPRMLLRCCQSTIVALALCLAPEVEAGFAQSARNIASDLDLWVAQELILPDEATAQEAPEREATAQEATAQEVVDLNLETPTPESTQTPEFSESIHSPEETNALASPSVSPENFLNQPTIGSQLLLPPGKETVQLLLAPAPETRQLFLPAARETQLLLPAARNTESAPSLAPVTSQRFLPAATMPVGLLSAAQDAPPVNPVENALTIAIEKEASPEPSLDSRPRQESVQEQVGRTLARTSRTHNREGVPSRSPVSSPVITSSPDQAQSTPALLPASPIPPSPVSPNSVSRSAVARSLLTAQTKPSPRNQTDPRSDAQPDAQSEVTPEPTSDPTSVASRDLGVAVAPNETTPPWFSLQNQIMAAVGIFVLFLVGLIRWATGGRSEAIVEETDWNNLPRSKSSQRQDKLPTPPAEPVKPRRDFSAILQSAESRYIASFLPPGGSAKPPSQHPVEPPVDPLVEPAKPATTALPPTSPRNNLLLLTEDDDRSPSTERQKKSGSFTLPNSEIGLWVTIAFIGLIGLGAWLIQFYASAG